jgi:hypothetical protein
MSNTFDVAKRTLQLRTIRQKIKAIKERHEQELAEFVDLEQKLVGAIFDFLVSTNQQHAKTINGTVYKIQKITYPLEDQVQFRRHVIGTESWQLLDWRANKTATDAYRLANGGEMKDGILVGGDLPPGVRKNELLTLGVKAPTKPKTTVTPNEAHNGSWEDTGKQEVLSQDETL